MDRVCHVSLRAGMCLPGKLSDVTHPVSPTQKGERLHETRVRRATLTTTQHRHKWEHIHTYLHTFIPSFIHSYIHTFIHSYIHSEVTLSTRGTRTHRCHLYHHTHGCTAVSFQTWFLRRPARLCSPSFLVAVPCR